jgi:uncharacterized protein (TIGR00251 family)
LISDAAFYRWQDGALTLFCHLQPKASRDEFAGQHGDRLKIRITAPPVDGKANAHLIEFLAAQFGVAKQAVSIVSGDSGRQKTVRIDKPKQLPAALSIAPPAVNL